MNTNRRSFIKLSGLSGLATALSSLGIKAFAATEKDVLVVQTGLLTDNSFAAGTGATSTVSLDLKRVESYQTLVEAFRKNRGVNVFALVDGSMSFMLEEAIRDSDSSLVGQFPVSFSGDDMQSWAYHIGRELADTGVASIKTTGSETALIAFQVRT